MSSTFWTNTIWFLLLFISSIVSAILILHKAQNPRFAFAFLFSAIGISFVFEAILVLGFKAYSYYPKLFRDSYLDIIFGNYFSQISVSATSLLLAVYESSYIWYGVFGFIYFLIEVLFIKLGIYEHFWYKSVYTFFAFILFASLIKIWYKSSKDSKSRLINYLCLYFSVASFSTFTIFLGQRLLGIQLLQSKLFFTDVNRNNTSSGFVYQFIVLNYLIILYKSNLNRVVKAIAFAFLYLAQYLAYRMGYLYITDGLFFLVTSLDLLGCYCLIVVFNYLLVKDKIIKKTKALT